MPIELKVGSEFDETSARKAAAEAREYYKRQATELEVKAKLDVESARKAAKEAGDTFNRDAALIKTAPLRVDAILNRDSAKEVMREFEAQLKASKKPTIEVETKVDRDSMGRAFRSAVTEAEQAGKGAGQSFSTGFFASISDLMAKLGTALPGGLAGQGGLVGFAALVPILTDVAGIAASAAQSLWLLPAAAGAAGAGIGTLMIATQGFGQAMKDMGDPKKFVADLQLLAPSAQQAALEIKKLVDGPLKGLERATQDALFSGVGQQLQQLTTTFMPAIQQMTTGVAGAFNQMFTSVSAQLQTTGTSSAIQGMLSNITASFRDLAPAAAPFIKALSDIALVGSGFLPGLAQSVTNAANAFAQFIQHAKETGDLKRWIGEGLDTLKQLGAMAWDLGKAFMGLAPVGQQILPEIVKLVHNIAEIIPPLASFVKTLGDNFLGLYGAVKVFDSIFTAVGTVTGAIRALTGDISALPGVIQHVADAMMNLLGPLQPLFKLLGISTSTASATANAQASMDAARAAAAGGGAPGGVPPGLPGAAPTGPWDSLSPADKWSRADAAAHPGAATAPAGPGTYRKRDGSIGYIQPPSTLPDIIPPPLPSVPSGGAGGGAPKASGGGSATSPSGFLVPANAAIAAIQFAQQQVGKPYGASAGPTFYDCSGFMSDIFAVMTGKPYQGSERYFTTEANFPSLGFEPGFQAGAFNIGVNSAAAGFGANAHMAGTLPNGMNVEAGGGPGGVKYGGAAKGAKDFAQVYHLRTDKSFNGSFGDVPGATGLGDGSLPSGEGDGIRVFVTNMGAGGMGGSGGPGGGGLGGAGGAGGDPLSAFFGGMASAGGPLGPIGTLGQNIIGMATGGAGLLGGLGGGGGGAGSGGLAALLGVSELGNAIPGGSSSSATGFSTGAPSISVGAPSPSAGGPSPIGAGWGSGGGAPAGGGGGGGGGGGLFGLPGGGAMGFWGGGGPGGAGAGKYATTHVGNMLGEKFPGGTAFGPGSGNFNPNVQLDTSNIHSTYPAEPPGFSVGPHGIPYGGKRGPYPATLNPPGHPYGFVGAPGGPGPGAPQTTAAPGPGNFAGGPGTSPGGFDPSGSGSGGAPEVQGREAGEGGWQPSGGGFQGLGGAPLAAIKGAASSAASAFAPGAGAATDMAIEAANKAAAFGGKALAIGAQGLSETLLPHGSELGDPSKNWLGKIASGFAGAKPAGTNSAGKQETPNKTKDPNKDGSGSVDPNTKEHGKGGGRPPGPQNGVYIENLHNNGKPDDGTKVANDINAGVNSYGAGGPR